MLSAAAADVVAAAKQTSKLFTDVTVLKKAVVIPKVKSVESIEFGSYFFLCLIFFYQAETTKAKSSGTYFGSEMQKFEDLALGSKTEKRRKAQYAEALRLQVGLKDLVSLCQRLSFAS